MDDQEIQRFMQRVAWFGKEPDYPMVDSPMYERFTDRARKVMQLANQECERLQHEWVGTEHILMGLLKEGSPSASGVAGSVLRNLGLDLNKVREEVQNLVIPGPAAVDDHGGLRPLTKLPLTPRAKKAIEFAIEEAKALEHNYIGTEHLLLGLLRVEEGVAAQVLMNFKVSLESVRQGILDLLGAPIQKPAEDAESHVKAMWQLQCAITQPRETLAEIERIVTFETDPAKAVEEIKKFFPKKE